MTGAPFLYPLLFSLTPSSLPQPPDAPLQIAQHLLDHQRVGHRPHTCATGASIHSTINSTWRITLEKKSVSNANHQLWIIQVPNVLAANVEDVDKFYARIKSVPTAERYEFDMSIVGFIKPYGAIALVIAARLLYDLSGQAVRISNLADNLYLYLKRMDVFDIGARWLQPSISLNEDWSRDPQTPNLLELTAINSPKSIETVVARAETIFTHWLKIPDLHKLLRVISELCTNIYDHSRDSYGCIIIQKYQHLTQNQIAIRLAVGDLGCGIRGSLVERHGEIGESHLDYLRKAISGGWTARNTGRGGLGLRTVEEIATSGGGSLWLRSETSAIFSKGPGKTKGSQELVCISGTQIAVEFCAPLQG